MRGDAVSGHYGLARYTGRDPLQIGCLSGSGDVQKVEMADKGLMTNAALMAPSVMAQIMFTLVLLLFPLASGEMFYEKRDPRAVDIQG